MDTIVSKPGSVTTQQHTAKAQGNATAVEASKATPEKVELPQAAPAADSGHKPTLGQAAPNSALTTYKDQDSGRLIVRVYDRESGDVLIEFPPERAFRPATTPVGTAVAKPKRSFSV